MGEEWVRDSLPRLRHFTVLMDKKLLWHSSFVPCISQIYGMMPCVDKPRSWFIVYLISPTSEPRVPQTVSDEDFVEIEPTFREVDLLKPFPKPASTTWESIQGVVEEGSEIFKSLLPQGLL